MLDTMEITEKTRQLYWSQCNRLLKSDSNNTEALVSFDRAVCQQWLRYLKVNENISVAQLNRFYSILELTDLFYEENVPNYAALSKTMIVEFGVGGLKANLQNVREITRLTSEIYLSRPGGYSSGLVYNLQAFYIEQVRNRVWCIVS